MSERYKEISDYIQSSKYISEMTDRSKKMLYWLKQHGFVKNQETILELHRKMIETPILVVLDPLISKTYEGQVCLQMLINQLVRSCFKISFLIPKVPLTVPITLLASKKKKNEIKDKFLDEEIIKLANEINIFGEFTNLLDIEKIEETKNNFENVYRILFIVGRSKLEEILTGILNKEKINIVNNKKYSNILQIPNKYWIASYGWSTYISKKFRNFEKLNSSENERLFSTTNPLGAFLASTIALNDGLKILLGIKNVSFINNESVFKFSLFDYTNQISENSKENKIHDNPILPKKISLEKIAIIGAGAIGGALIYLLPFFNSKENQQSLSFKELILVDNDIFELSNLNRVLFADKNSVEKKKVKIAKNFLENNDFNKVDNEKFNIITIDNTFENIDDELENFNLIAVVTVDTIRSRQAIQKKLPKSIINLGSKEFTFEISIHRDILTDACLLCSYPEEESDFELLSRKITLKRKKDSIKNDNDSKDVKKLLDDELDEEEISNVRLEIIKNTEKGYRLDEAAALVAGYKTINYPDITSHLTEILGIEPDVPTLAPISVFPAIIAISEIIKQEYFPDKTLKNKWQTNLLQFPRIKGIMMKQAKKENCWCQGKYVKKLYYHKYKEEEKAMIKFKMKITGNDNE